MILKGLLLTLFGSICVFGNVEVVPDPEPNNYPQQQYAVPDYAYQNVPQGQPFQGGYFGGPNEYIQPQAQPYPFIPSAWSPVNSFQGGWQQPLDPLNYPLPLSPMYGQEPVEVIGPESPPLENFGKDFYSGYEPEVYYPPQGPVGPNPNWNGMPDQQEKSDAYDVYGPCGDYNVDYGGGCNQGQDMVPVCNIEVCMESCKKVIGDASEGACFENECYCRKVTDEAPEEPEEPEEPAEPETIIDWTYSNQGDWPAKYPSCGGLHQSPKRIMPEHQRDLSRKSTWNYDTPVKLLMENNGHFVRVYIQSLEDPSVTLHGVEVDKDDWSGTYSLAFMDIHWGSSEHTITGQRLNGEVQLHHYNSWFDSYEEALQHKGGTLAVAILIKEESSEESLLANIVSKVQFIKKPNIVGYTPIEDFTLVDLIEPLDTNFGLYLGSQTHPPCTPGVRWLVARNSIPAGTEDVMQLQRLEDINGRPIVQNSRSIQQ